MGAIAIGSFVYIKDTLGNNKSKIYFFGILILLTFVIITGAGIVKKNSLDITSFSGIAQFTKLYFVWIGHAIGNMKSLTGNAVNMEWIPTNSTG